MSDPKVKFGDKLKQKLNFGAAPQNNKRDPIANTQGAQYPSEYSSSTTNQGAFEPTDFSQPRTLQPGFSDTQKGTGGLPANASTPSTPNQQEFAPPINTASPTGGYSTSPAPTAPDVQSSQAFNQGAQRTAFPDTQTSNTHSEYRTSNYNSESSSIIKPFAGATTGPDYAHEKPPQDFQRPTAGFGDAHAKSTQELPRPTAESGYAQEKPSQDFQRPTAESGHAHDKSTQNFPRPTAGGSGIAASKPDPTDVGISTKNLTGTAGSQAPRSPANTSVNDKAGNASQQSSGQQQSQTALGSAQGLGAAALENAQATWQQVKQSIGGAVDTDAIAGSVGQASSAVLKKLDEQGINSVTTKQKLGDVGQTLKDYGAIGQENSAEYLQQAVDAAHAVGKDGENQSIIAKVLGAVALVWLAFGFSLSALIALGVITATAAILSRYSGRRSQAQQGRGVTKDQSSYSPASKSAGQADIDTHFPQHRQGAHPDSSIKALQPQSEAHKH